jgi:hypothetical protein
MDCLALSYLEVLQAAPMDVPAMVAAVDSQTGALRRFPRMELEPQCRRLANLFAVPALQPLLLAQGGVEALLVSCSLPADGQALPLPKAIGNVCNCCQPHPVPALCCVQDLDPEHGIDSKSAAHLASSAVHFLLHACRACSAVASGLRSDGALLCMLTSSAFGMEHLPDTVPAEVRRLCNAC